ncbi:hypothetical protein AUC69_13720 [Methyloceanibacter superfactus]|uniref:Rap1a immunity protein domain-containing protein n=1 Tax=Methyloceanibacter superfactus TaxID=1774969 RepID=A0A1E3VT41_9HYPH|nr:hypothetical protein [Methyloceanibacter superfactus]ODR96665.1 hypothetical protein AUC69_13720 [Methyloceanibacter superfactus]
MKTLATIATFIALTTAAHAADVSGEDLLDACDSDLHTGELGAMKEGMCLGYTMASGQILTVLGISCAPSSVSVGAMRALVIEQMRTAKKGGFPLSKTSASQIFYLALKYKGWVCKDRQADADARFLPTGR